MLGLRPLEGPSWSMCPQSELAVVTGKLLGFSPDFSERYQKRPGDQQGGMVGERSREAWEGRRLSNSHSCVLLCFPLLFQPPARLECKALSSPEASPSAVASSQHTPHACAYVGCCGNISVGLNGAKCSWAGRWTRARCIFKAIWGSQSPREEPSSLVSVFLL